MRGSACLPECDFIAGTANALAISNPLLNITSHNNAAGGETHATSWSKAQTVIPAGKTGFVFWFVWSPNDGASTANIQSDYDTYIVPFINFVHAAGGIPVLLTSLPCVCILTSTDDAARLSINNAIMGLAAPDVIAIDMSALLTNGATPERIPSGLTTDGKHANAAGAALMQSAAQSAVQTYINTH
jgi:hypothetical protein